MADRLSRLACFVLGASGKRLRPSLPRCLPQGPVCQRSRETTETNTSSNKASNIKKPGILGQFQYVYFQSTLVFRARIPTKAAGAKHGVTFLSSFVFLSLHGWYMFSCWALYGSLSKVNTVWLRPGCRPRQRGVMTGWTRCASMQMLLIRPLKMCLVFVSLFSN